MSDLTSKLFREDPATYYAELGAKAERERIIEIIERCPRADDDYMILCDARHLIALIKGEQK